MRHESTYRRSTEIEEQLISVWVTAGLDALDAYLCKQAAFARYYIEHRGDHRDH